MNLRIVADSSANLTADPRVFSAPLRVVTAQREYVDVAGLDTAAMVAELAAYKGRSSTACPGVGDWLDAFGEADAVIAMTITSVLSGSFNSARAAADEFLARHPAAKIFIFDSRTTGPEMVLLAEFLLRRADEGADFETLKMELIEYKKRTELLFSLSSLNNFARNGRVKPALAKAVGLLGLRIVGCAKDGDLHPMHKPRGDKRAVEQLFASMVETGYAGGKVRITHTLNPEAAEQLAARIRQAYPNVNLTISPNGGLCSFYCEPGGLLLGYEKG